MKNYGDICQIKGYEVPLVDVITGGSPCQDLSVAGKRAGLKHSEMGDDETTRSGLFMEQIRIIKEQRNESIKRLSDGGSAFDIRCVQPRYTVWENVCGAFSSNNGEDFRAVLEETVKVADENAHVPGIAKGQKWAAAGCIMGDGYSVAWRVHDAQFWGVPQRRKRICVLADYGGATAPEILFELIGEADYPKTEQIIGGSGAESRPEVQPLTESLSGNFEQSRKKGEKATAYVGDGITQTGGSLSFQERAGKPGGGKGILIQNERTGALSTLNNQSVCAFEPGAASRVGSHVYDDVAGTIRANAGDNQQAVAYGISAYESNAMKSENPHSGVYEADTARTLDLNGGSPACNQGGIAVVYNGSNITCPVNASNPQNGDPCHTLTDDSRNLLVQSPTYALQGNMIGRAEQNGPQGDGVNEDVSFTLNATDRHGVAVIENHPADSRCRISKDGIVQTLSSRMGTGGNNVPMVMSELEPYTSTKVSCHTRFENNGVAETLVASDYKDPPTVSYGLDRASYNQGANAKFNFSIEEEKIGAQMAKGPGAVCTAVDCRNAAENEMNGSLQAKASNNLNSNNVCRVNSIVRRLTPLECCRLQNFPDGWMDIGEWTDSKGKLHKDSDAPKYKAAGNSIALPFWQWLMDRIAKQLKKDGCDNPTMASLFDGISGFPLCAIRGGIKPVWSSEIEEFPMAVAERHFGENGDLEKFL